MLLKEMRPGMKAKIKRFTKGTAQYRQRLLMLGITPGVVIKLIRVAPLGDPVEISVRGSLVTLRKEEADVMDVEWEE